jgi:hypothetical protein
MGSMRIFRLLIMAGVLGGVLSLSGVAPPVAQAAPAATASTDGYGPDDDYVLVKDCPRAVCAAPADWRPGERLLHRLFVERGWGRDPAVVSRMDAHRLTWGQWAADHLYYVDEASPAARRAALSTALHDPHGRSVHIVRVPALR